MEWFSRILGLALILSPAGCGERVDEGSLHLYDLAGRPTDPFMVEDRRPIVFFFTRSDCPISNRYAPEVRRLYERFSEQVAFRLVYVDPDEPTESIKRHLEEYRYPLEALRDPEHELVRLTGARVTPEAALFAPGGRLVYRGRIDDRYVDFGRRRAEPSSRDLERALEEVARGEVGRPVTTEAVGCFISDLR